MPIYEYECTECGRIVEEMQSFSDAPLTTCSSCSGDMRKLISSSSFMLKGGGWYADGYSNCSAKGCAGATACDAAKSPTKSEAKSCPASGACGCA